MNEIQPWRQVSEPLEAKAVVEPIDAGFPDHSDPAPEVWNPRYTPMQPGDQRASQRYAAVGGRSWLGWYEGSRFQQTPAWILNISASGCLIAADAPAPLDRSIWLRLDDAAVPDWSEVRVISHQRTNAGLLASRLVFRGTCPYDMMKAVAFGPSHQRPGPEPSRSWSFNSW
jgi:hypothetical protein